MSLSLSYGVFSSSNTWSSDTRILRRTRIASILLRSIQRRDRNQSVVKFNFQSETVNFKKFLHTERVKIIYYLLIYKSRTKLKVINDKVVQILNKVCTGMSVPNSHSFLILSIFFQPSLVHFI
jgi:hypothetical protein